MNYRKASINDIQYLVQYRKQQLTEGGEFLDIDLDKELSDYFKSAISQGSVISWLATDDGKVVAVSCICFYQLPPKYSNPTGRVAYITSMYTQAEYRKRGIASHLLKLIIEEAKERNIKIIKLHASDDVKSIYSKIGFIDSEGYMDMEL